MKRRVQQQKDSQDGDRNNNRQPCVGALLAFILAGPIERIALREIDLGGDVVDGLLDCASQVPAADAVFDRDIPGVVLAVDHGSALLDPDITQFRESDPLTAWSEKLDSRDLFLGTAELRQVTSN